jgi:hypothetical protein
MNARISAVTATATLAAFGVFGALTATNHTTTHTAPAVAVPASFPDLPVGQQDDAATVTVGGDPSADSVTQVPSDGTAAGQDSGGAVVTVGGDPTAGAVTEVPSTGPEPGQDPGGATVTIGGDDGSTTVTVPSDYGTAEEWGFGAANPPNYDPQSPVNDPDPIPTDYP